MLSYEAIRKSLSNADATGQAAGCLIRLAHDISEGQFDPEVIRFIDEARGDDSIGDPGALPLLLRNIRAAELYVAGLKDLRTAILKRTIATPSAHGGK